MDHTAPSAPMISIIIPCYNHAQTLRETIDSVMASDYDQWEAIIVNDGSTDDSEAVGQSCAALDTRIHYISQPNSGPSAARNNAIRHSAGKYILPLDADDLIHPSYIGKAVAYLDSHEECALYYCRAEFFGSKQGPFQAYWTCYRDMLIVNSVFASSVYRRKDYDRIGGYDESFRTAYEDWEFYIRLLYHNDSVFQSPENMFYYRKGAKKSGRDDSAAQMRESVKNQITVKHAAKYVEYFGNYSFIIETSQPQVLLRNQRKLQKRLRSIRLLAIALTASVVLNFILLLL